MLLCSPMIPVSFVSSRGLTALAENAAAEGAERQAPAD